MSENFEEFINYCREIISNENVNSKTYLSLCSKMNSLIENSKDLLEGFKLQSNDEHYTRNLIHIDDQKLFSLYALVWLPGQWTPVHDHGTWGIVGVVSGKLQERNFIRNDKLSKDSRENIELLEAGSVLLSPCSTTSFVPNPDHIHITGNPSQEETVISLHLYGNAMAGFNIYNIDKKTRTWQEISHL